MSSVTVIDFSNSSTDLYYCYCC